MTEELRTASLHFTSVRLPQYTLSLLSDAMFPNNQFQEYKTFIDSLNPYEPLDWSKDTIIERLNYSHKIIQRKDRGHKKFQRAI